jgi:hypothetical protein
VIDLMLLERRRCGDARSSEQSHPRQIYTPYVNDSYVKNSTRADITSEKDEADHWYRSCCRRDRRGGGRRGW